MKIQWISGNQHGIVEDVERPVAEQAIGFGSAVLWFDTPTPVDTASLARESAAVTQQPDVPAADPALADATPAQDAPAFDTTPALDVSAADTIASPAVLLTGGG